MMPANDIPASTWLPAAPDASHAPGFASLVLRLRLALRRDPDPRKRELVEQILTAAAESEQRLVEQQARIDELQAMSSTDELTGLPNRRAFETFMTAELARARREQRGGCLAFLDLDRFKAINDRHGHAVGDTLLKAVAAALTGHVRASDVVGRLGGDEFGLVMWNVEGARAVAKAHDLERLIEEAHIPHGSMRLNVGASAGVVSLSGAAELTQLLDAADRAMYARKRERRG